ncbi:MAG: orotidine-5'-phosphate decarboxylase [Thermovirgaceae bacterium]
MNRKEENKKPGLILALDFENVDTVRRFLDSWGDRVTFIKIGPGLFARGGIPFIVELMGGGWKVFLDLKLHDIPNTVAGAVKVLSSEGVWAVTLHTSGGRDMMSAAAKECRDGTPLLFGVTVLTSLDQGSWEEVHPSCPMQDALLQRAKAAKNSQMDGIVCSPRELRLFSDPAFDGLIKIVPGIRPLGYEVRDDQKRTATPIEAAREGADFVVVGRPVIQAVHPGNVIDTILEDLKQ